MPVPVVSHRIKIVHPLCPLEFHPSFVAGIPDFVRNTEHKKTHDALQFAILRTNTLENGEKTCMNKNDTKHLPLIKPGNSNSRILANKLLLYIWHDYQYSIDG